MLTGGRSPFRDFNPEELLYVRFMDGINAKKGLLPSGKSTWEIQFRIPNQSANRSFPDSEPEDVLLPDYLDWGIVQFQVSSFPTDHQITTGDLFTMHPIHVPLPQNYYHCHLALFRNQQVEPMEKVGAQAKTHFRNLLNQIMEIQREPIC